MCARGWDLKAGGATAGGTPASKRADHCAEHYSIGVQRAAARMGLVEGRPGVGTFVARGVEEIDRERWVAAIFERLRVLVRDAAALGISQDDLWAGLDSEYERIPGEER